MSGPSYFYFAINATYVMKGGVIHGEGIYCT